MMMLLLLLPLLLLLLLRMMLWRRLLHLLLPLLAGARGVAPEVGDGHDVRDVIEGVLDGLQLTPRRWREPRWGQRHLWVPSGPKVLELRGHVLEDGPHEGVNGRLHSPRLGLVVARAGAPHGVGEGQRR